MAAANPSSRSLERTDRDDHVMPEVRIVAPLVVVVLVLAEYALYLFPESTDQHFAWNIKPPLTALAFGSGYLMGVYFFARVTFTKRWHEVAVGFLPITAFTVWMLLATLVHWDRFLHGTFAFYLWTAVYIVTPVLVPLLWFRNRVTDPGPTGWENSSVPSPLRRFALVVGIVFVLVSVVSFVLPDLLIAVFPWHLTPLTARVTAGWLSFPGVGGIMLSREPRWSSWRVVTIAAYVGVIGFVLSLLRAWSDLNLANPLAWLMVVFLVGYLVLAPFFFVYMERKTALDTGSARPSGTIS